MSNHYSLTQVIDLDKGARVTSVSKPATPNVRPWVTGDIIDLHLSFVRGGENVTAQAVADGAATVRALLIAELGGTVLVENDGYTLNGDEITFTFDLNDPALIDHMATVDGDAATLWFSVIIESADQSRRLTALLERRQVRQQGIA